MAYFIIFVPGPGIISHRKKSEVFLKDTNFKGIFCKFNYLYISILSDIFLKNVMY